MVYIFIFVCLFFIPRLNQKECSRVFSRGARCVVPEAEAGTDQSDVRFPQSQTKKEILPIVSLITRHTTRQQDKAKVNEVNLARLL